MALSSTIDCISQASKSVNTLQDGVNEINNEIMSTMKQMAILQNNLRNLATQRDTLLGFQQDLINNLKKQSNVYTFTRGSSFHSTVG